VERTETRGYGIACIPSLRPLFTSSLPPCPFQYLSPPARTPPCPFRQVLPFPLSPYLPLSSFPFAVSIACPSLFITPFLLLLPAIAWLELVQRCLCSSNETEARGLAQHSGPPGRPEESDAAAVILNVMDKPYCPPFPYRTGCPDRGCSAASW
jgi:hypothetical protein